LGIRTKWGTWTHSGDPKDRHDRLGIPILDQHNNLQFKTSKLINFKIRGIVLFNACCSMLWRGATHCSLQDSQISAGTIRGHLMRLETSFFPFTEPAIFDLYMTLIVIDKDIV
jgi:hypothetical protein